MSARGDGWISWILASSARDAEIAILKAKLAEAEREEDKLCAKIADLAKDIRRAYEAGKEEAADEWKPKLAEAEKLLDEIYIALDGLPISGDMASAKSRAYLDAPQQITNLRAKLTEFEEHERQTHERLGGAMMSIFRIYKYPLMITGVQYIEAKPGRVLHVGLDPKGVPCLWIHVAIDVPDIERKVFIVGTGHPIPEEACQHVGSFVQESFVWHVFIEA